MPSTRTTDASATYEPLQTLAPTASSNRYGTYSINVTYTTLNDNYTPPVSVQATAGTFDLRKLAAIAAPSTTMIVADGSLADYMMYLDTGAPPTMTLTNGIRTFGSSARVIYERHMDTTAVLYCDGHVKAVKMDALAARNSAGIYRNFTVEDD